MAENSYYKTSFYNDTQKNSYKLQLPSECIHCGRIMTPDVVAKTDYVGNKQALLLRCKHCNEFFPAVYKIHANVDHYESTAEYIPYHYSAIISYDLPDEIEQFSKNGVQIYKQALKAEYYDLNQITGLGFRKSLEFIIKDFLVNVRGEDKYQKKKIPLNQAIEDLDIDNLITLSKAASWIGNDEAHYLRKYSPKELNNMKRFIKALALYLSAEYSSLDAEKFISEN